ERLWLARRPVAQRRHRVDRVAVAVGVLQADRFGLREREDLLRARVQTVEIDRIARLERVAHAWVPDAALRALLARLMRGELTEARERARQDDRTTGLRDRFEGGRIEQPATEPV